jgi:hypothetical protein
MRPESRRRLGGDFLKEDFPLPYVEGLGMGARVYDNLFTTIELVEG